jgi:hypothetical protein
MKKVVDPHAQNKTMIPHPMKRIRLNVDLVKTCWKKNDAENLTNAIDRRPRMTWTLMTLI